MGTFHSCVDQPPPTGRRLLVRKEDLAEFLHTKGRDLIADIRITRCDQRGSGPSYDTEDSKRSVFDRLLLLRRSGAVEAAERRFDAWLHGPAAGGMNDNREYTLDQPSGCPTNRGHLHASSLLHAFPTSPLRSGPPGDAACPLSARSEVNVAVLLSLMRSLLCRGRGSGRAASAVAIGRDHCRPSQPPAHASPEVRAHHA